MPTVVRELAVTETTIGYPATETKWCTLEVTIGYAGRLEVAVDRIPIIR